MCANDFSKTFSLRNNELVGLLMMSRTMKKDRSSVLPQNKTSLKGIKMMYLKRMFLFIGQSTAVHKLITFEESFDYELYLMFVDRVDIL